MSWQDVDKGSARGGASGRFLALEAGESVRIRVLDEEPFTTRVHKISQPVGPNGTEVFRTIPATASVDDNYILRHNSRRYPDVMQYNMRVFVYGKTEAGQFTAEKGEIKILQGGPAIFKPLRELYTQNGSLNQFDIIVKREGEGRDTQYFVTANPTSFPVDVAALTAGMASDESWVWENIFPPITGEDQMKMLQEANFNVHYDPAAALASSMSVDQAKNVKFTFGKHKGKTLNEVLVLDAGYIEWAADTVTSNDELAAACRVVVKSMASLEAGTTAPTPKAVAGPPAAAPASTPAPVVNQQPAPAATPAATQERSEMQEHITAYFDRDPRFENMQKVLDIVKRHGNGKTRVKDLTDAQMASLLVELSTQE